MRRHGDCALANRQRNQRIIELRKQGLTFGQIGRQMGLTKGTVTGVVWRWLEANWVKFGV